MSSLRRSLHFFGTFLRNPTTVGSVLPSSRSLSRLLVDGEHLAPGDLVVEYGPGTGSMTAVIAELVAERDARYVGIELDDGFCRVLRARFPALEFVHGSVTDVERILTERELPRPKLIVSGLPFASLPPAIGAAVVDATRSVLAADGQFRTFQYVHAYGMPKARKFRTEMAARFARFERCGPVVRNVPPAYVLVYRV